MSDNDQNAMDLAKRTADIAELFVKNSGQKFETPQQYLDFLAGIRASLTGGVPVGATQISAAEAPRPPASEISAPTSQDTQQIDGSTAEAGVARKFTIEQKALLKGIKAAKDIPADQEPLPFEQLPADGRSHQPFAVGLAKRVGHTYAQQRNAVEEGPVVPVNMSVFDSVLICLEDGDQCKTLRRHLKSKYGMTMEEYFAKWRLPSDYPTVSPEYGRKRKLLAQKQWDDKRIQDQA